MGRYPFGEIKWLGPTDIRGLRLPDLMFIEDNEVAVYDGLVRKLLNACTYLSVCQL